MTDPTTATLSNGCVTIPTRDMAKALFNAEPHNNPSGIAPVWEDQPDVIKAVWYRRARAALAQSAAAPAVDRCTKDGEPCCIGDEDDAHFRCGTVQCGMLLKRPVAPTVPAERVLALEAIVARWDEEMKVLKGGVGGASEYDAGAIAAYRSCAANVRRWIKALTDG